MPGQAKPECCPAVGSRPGAGAGACQWRGERRRRQPVSRRGVTVRRGDAAGMGEAPPGEQPAGLAQASPGEAAAEGLQQRLLSGG